MRGGNHEDPLAALIVAARRHARELENEVREGEEIRVYGEPTTEPILGNNLTLPEIEDIRPKPILAESVPFVSVYFIRVVLSQLTINIFKKVPIYTHLKYIPTDIIELPAEPELLTKTRAITFMQGEAKTDDFEDDEPQYREVSYDLE